MLFVFPAGWVQPNCHNQRTLRALSFAFTEELSPVSIKPADEDRSASILPGGFIDRLLSLPISFAEIFWRPIAILSRGRHNDLRHRILVKKKEQEYATHYRRQRQNRSRRIANGVR